jgi:DnaJ-domain-containing protein 1
LEYRPNRGGTEDENENQRITLVLKPENFGYFILELDFPLTVSSMKLQNVSEETFHKSFLKRIMESLTSDEEWHEEYERSMSSNLSPGITYLNGALYYKNRL